MFWIISVFGLAATCVLHHPWAHQQLSEESHIDGESRSLATVGLHAHAWPMALLLKTELEAFASTGRLAAQPPHFVACAFHCSAFWGGEPFGPISSNMMDQCGTTDFADGLSLSRGTLHTGVLFPFVAFVIRPLGWHQSTVKVKCATFWFSSSCQKTQCLSLLPFPVNFLLMFAHTACG